VSAPKGKRADDEATIGAVDVGKIYGTVEALLRNISLRVVQRGSVLGVPDHNGVGSAGRRRRAWSKTLPESFRS
jgi:hypothetical protein